MSPLERLAAFTDVPDGGNPAGVWVGETLPSPEEMQAIATNLGFSETVFIAPLDGPDRTARYYSPEAEVTFCGHATIAAGVLLGETSGDGTYRLSTLVGIVPVDVRTKGELREASLTSIEPKQTEATDALVSETLATLQWDWSDLDRTIPPAKAYAGAWHLVLAVKRKETLATLEYDFAALKAIMLREGLTTLQLVWRESADTFHARNPFPVGGVVEDPATGAAAAALGGYLRALGAVPIPSRISIQQGETIGRPSRVIVDIPARGGIVVTGTAVHL